MGIWGCTGEQQLSVPSTEQTQHSTAAPAGQKQGNDPIAAGEAVLGTGCTLVALRAQLGLAAPWGMGDASLCTHHDGRAQGLRVGIDCLQYWGNWQQS